MSYPSPRATSPGHPTTHPAETSRAPERSSPAPALLVALLAFLLGGCVTAEDYCRVGVSATVRAVDTAMSVAGEMHAAKKITDETAWKLVAAHDTYRPVAKTAKAACDAIGNVTEADAELRKLQAAADKVLRSVVEEVK